jgi:hypothetical protein
MLARENSFPPGIRLASDPPHTLLFGFLLN